MQNEIILHYLGKALGLVTAVFIRKVEDMVRGRNIPVKTDAGTTALQSQKKEVLGSLDGLHQLATTSTTLRSTLGLQLFHIPVKGNSFFLKGSELSALYFTLLPMPGPND